MRILFKIGLKFLEPFFYFRLKIDAEIQLIITFFSFSIPDIGVHLFCLYFHFVLCLEYYD
jgi:hypothetical protein